jgi:PTH1 family peptidyl-tRNA hydrolase
MDLERRLIVGLGNPGAQYRATRHNVGFMVLDRLLAAHPPQRSRTKFNGELFEARVEGAAWLLLKPQTFMNLSGQAIAAAMRFYDLPAEALLVVCDDFHLSLGRLRLRRDGSAGGQRGLADTIARLGTNQFARLRIGIAAPSGDAVEHVLGSFAPDERLVIEQAVGRAAEAVELWAAAGIEAAMNSFNPAP